MAHEEGVSQAVTAEVSLLLRFQSGSTLPDVGQPQLEELADALGAAAGCQRVELGRAIEDSATWVLLSVWRSVGDYRRALSTYEVKLRQPLLARAVDEPSAFELLYVREGERTRRAVTGLSEEPGSLT